MMPTRMIRESLLSSDRFLSLPDNTARMCYIACILTADDRGNREAGLGHLVRLWRDFGVDATEKAAAIGQFLADQDLIRFYEVDGKRYLHVPRFNQRLRHLKRAHPLSPWCKTPIKSDESYQLRQQSADARQTHGGPSSAEEKRREEKRSEVKRIKTLSGKPDFGPQALEVLHFLNAKTNRAYRATAVNLELIAARLKEGATVADCRMVIARKCREWLTDEKMAVYLRPATLFNRTKFNQYIGECVNVA